MWFGLIPWSAWRSSRHIDVPMPNPTLEVHHLREYDGKPVTVMDATPAEGTPFGYFSRRVPWSEKAKEWLVQWAYHKSRPTPLEELHIRLLAYSNAMLPPSNWRDP